MGDFALGLALGLLVAAVALAVLLGAYVQSDMGAFHRWVEGL